jgi:uncharacterized membrane protein
MGRFRTELRTHLRNKLVAGALAAGPVAVTFFILWYVDTKARAIIGVNVPFLGTALTVIAIYLLGLFVTSFIGQWLLGLADRALRRIPGLRALYRSWRQVALTDANDGIFTHVVLVPDDSGRGCVLGFTNGHAIEGDPGLLCVFIPGSPNPTTGRLYFVPSVRCIRLDLSPQEALKMLISGGNYIPAALGATTANRVRF